MKYKNPIISGFFPDPSICRVDDTFYLVCSSFQFFPGVPLFESKDLVNWEMIGNVLTRESQLPLAHTDSCGGIYAPTIRYNNGRFYMVTTNVTSLGNFYVYTDDIHGEWSEPIQVEQGGIDPSLFFENGKTYFMSNGTDDSGIDGITQCEIDIDTGKKLTPSRSIWNGTGGRFLESPHLYKIHDTYYLMASEGGTEYGHMVVYAKGDSPYGPFTPYEKNPVLTNRNLGGYHIQGCGHADLVDDVNGNWWMVHLGFRQLNEWVMHHVTGREVYLVPVTFDENGWFTAGDNGTTREFIETDRIGDDVTQKSVSPYTFENTSVGKEWCFLQNPVCENYVLTDKTFSLKSTELNLSSHDGSPSFIGVRQKEMNFNVSADLKACECEGGITLYMTPQQHYDIAIRKNIEGYEIVRRLVIGNISEEKTAIITAKADTVVTLKISGSNFNYDFSAAYDGKNIPLGGAETKYLSTEIAGNFTGVMIGLYASNFNEHKAKDVHFENFNYSF